jgi:diguanylate cyclase (GGDEF)-like protein
MIPAARDLVLVVDDDPDIVRFVQVNLEVEGFDVIGARNGFEALRMAIRDRPDLAVIDVMMPGVDGLELTRRLRNNPATSAMPIIMLTAKGQTVDKVIGLTAGADDYVLKPFDTMELVARIRSMLRRTKEIRESSPLTGLPGNNRILQEVQTRAANHEAFAVGHIDIDRFKTVNDAYGFARGDEFIAALAECLQNAADAIETSPRPFIGHIGGDDFVLVCTPEQVKPLTHHAIHAFLAAADAISDPIDAQRGYLQITDRRGNVRRANLVTISIGVSLSTSREFADPREVLAAASEMKSVAKTQPGSYVAIDRRSVDDGDERPVSPAGSGSIPLPRRGVQPWPDELGENWTGPDWTDDVDDDWVDAPSEAPGSDAPPRPSWTVPSQAGPPQAGPSQAVPSQPGAPPEMLSQAMQRRDVPLRSMPSQSVPPQSVPSQSVPSQSVPSQSVPSQSVPSQSVPSQSVPSQPMPSEPAPSPSPARSVASRPVPPDSVAAPSAPRHTDESRGQPAAPSPYPPPWADPPSGAGRSQPHGRGGNGYGHGPAVGVAIGSSAGLTGATAHLPIVPDRRDNDSDDEARWRERNDRDVRDRDVNDRDRDVNDRDVDDRDWSDGDRDDHRRNADGPLEYAPWADELDPAPLPPGWRGL